MKLRTATRERWRLRIEEWQASGKSGVAWTHENNLPYQTFLYWKSQLVGRATNPSASSFIELKDRPLKGGALEIEVDGCVIRVHRGFDPFLLKSCITLLKGISC